MTNKGVFDEHSIIVDELEMNLEKALSKKREEVERAFNERIRQEREELEKRLKEIDKEYEKEHSVLHSYKSVITEFELGKKQLQDEMKGHLDRAVGYQKDIERSTASTLEELRSVSELNLKLETLRQAADEKAGLLKKELKEKFGIVAQVPEQKENAEIMVDLDHELQKLKKIKELLESVPLEPEKPEEPFPFDVALPQAEKKPEEPLPVEPVARAREEEPVIPPQQEALPEEPAAEHPAPLEQKEGDDFPPRIPEIAEWVERAIPDNEAGLPEEGWDVELHEETLPAEVPAPPEDISAPLSLQKLEKFRETDSAGQNGEVGYFHKGERIILDAESLFRAIVQVLGEAKKVNQKLAETKSPKDQFFIKQELINQQEILRKVVLKSVRMCDAEKGSFPRYTSDILNSSVLRDLLEKLSIANWSNPEELHAFEMQSQSLIDAFYKKISPPARYIASLLEELKS